MPFALERTFATESNRELATQESENSKNKNKCSYKRKSNVTLNLNLNYCIGIDLIRTLIFGH